MRSNLSTITFFILLLLLTGCISPASKDVTNTQSNDQHLKANSSMPSEVSAEKLNTLPDPVSLTVLAAASLTESFTELGKAFETKYPWVTITFNFAGSQTLAEQLAQGAPADVFASANMRYFKDMVEQGIINQDGSAIFAVNRLVMIYPIDNPAGLNKLIDLANPGVKIILADESVPVGTYSINFLENASTNNAYGVSFKDDVLKNVVSYENNVKSVLAKVALDEADAGIVYISDINGDIAANIGWINIPDELNTDAKYPIAPVTTSDNLKTAQLFIDFVLSPQGQQILKGFNFIPAVN